MSHIHILSNVRFCSEVKLWQIIINGSAANSMCTLYIVSSFCQSHASMYLLNKNSVLVLQNCWSKKTAVSVTHRALIMALYFGIGAFAF